MSSSNPTGPADIVSRPETFHRWRSLKDRFARWVIGLGGLTVIAAVLLILLYLVYVVAPLFLPARAASVDLGEPVGWSVRDTLLLAVEEQQRVALKVGEDGSLVFFSLPDMEVISPGQLPGSSARAVLAVAAQGHDGLVAVAREDGSVVLFRQQYRTDFSAGVEHRRIRPSIDYPYGEDGHVLLPGGGVTGLAVSDSEAELVIAAAGAGGRVAIDWREKQENFLTGEVSLTRSVRSMEVGFEITGIAVSGDHRWLYLGDGAGQVHFGPTETMVIRQSVAVSNEAVTSMSMLLGGISLLAGDAGGSVTQLFPVRGEDNAYRLETVRVFDGQQSAVVSIIPEQRRKGFVSIDAGGSMAIYHSTAGRLVLRESLAGGLPVAQALAPRASGMLVLNEAGNAVLVEIDNEHPEVSFASLWSKVWYENYSEPEYVWQSSASNNDFEPKFSLTPLAFGTLKAALYAMLFALPLALMGAAYTAYFMSGPLRNVVKPAIEIMAALPTVILGFLAGLWFAPFLEENLAGIFSMLVIMPAGLLVFAWFWTKDERGVASRVPEGWEALVLVPVLLVLAGLSMWLADPVQGLFFGGDLRTWLSREAGISYDQRNAVVVGCAMGFAVIPTIFSIAEDAIYGVPRSLSNGSLALGATPWQTLVRVVLPTASPGMFSAVMIGLGRAVGETMIVLMATGNTPIMDWNLFEGMRTLAANIAVEMPESAMNSSHYRILFLAALVLFLFTFVVNTGAELIRQRLREKYSSL